jgi:hypothetical protein
MHKNDPYTMALALAESNRRKQMRKGAQMQAPQQPKVVDQEIAGMAAVDPMGNVTGYAGGGYLPEDTGIGQLPAPNMERMAEGGIVAFEDGGEVPRYYDGVFLGQGVNQNPLIPPGQNRNALMANKMASISAQETQDELLKINSALQTLPPGQQRSFLENRKRILLDGKPSAPTSSSYTAPQVAPAVTPSVTPPPAPPVAPPVAPPPSPLAKKPPAKAPAVAKPAEDSPAVGLPALNTTAMTAAEAAAAAEKLGDNKILRQELQGYVDRQKEIGTAAVGSFERGIAGLPQAYKQYEERLQKEETEAATDKNKALGMSIFKAGLAMMSGTSQNAFENIGKGAMVGLEDQQAALKDFKKAQRERDKALGDIEAARLADKRGDLKTKLELESRAADRNAAAEGKMVDGIAELFKTDKTNARGIYQTGIEQLNQNQRTIYTTAADMQKQAVADKAAMERTNAQVAGSLAATRINADTYKLPMLYKSVEDSVDKMLLADVNYRTADETTKARLRDEALRKRLLATPGLAQYAGETTGGGSASGLRYNPQTGKIE